METCKLNNVDPVAWLTWVLKRLPDHKVNRIDEIDALELAARKSLKPRLNRRDTFFVWCSALGKLVSICILSGIFYYRIFFL